MPFKAEDVRIFGRVPNHTAFCYAIYCDEDQIGQVNFAGAFGMMNAGEDVPEFIATTLNRYEEGLGEEKLREALEMVVSL